jgi:hypothetical protein
VKKTQFEHTVRAAGAILDATEILVIGSQAVHASINFEFPEAERSIKVDISAVEDSDGSKADLIDGSIGELSAFQETFGYFAQGVTPDTATLPRGWRKRLVPYCTPATNGITALCLDLHDLWISKAVAGRPKDREFCRALLGRGVVSEKTLRRRLGAVNSIDANLRDRICSNYRL